MARHYSSSAYCVSCRLRLAVCVCSIAPRLRIATRLIVVMHSSEWAKPANTGHMVRLAIENADVRLHGRLRGTKQGDVDARAASTLVLFPGRGAVPLTPEYLGSLSRPVTLLVPDGNWTQAKNMMRRLAMLRDARPVRLETPSLNIPWLRCNHGSDHRSTFEAIAQTLGLIEGPAVEDRLLDFFHAALLRRRSATCPPGAIPP